MKKGIPALPFYLLVVCLLLALHGISAGDESSGETVTVQGTGYPPIKAESVSQARLMARRAAVLDIYRNALRKKSSPDGGDDVSYQELSGFVSGINIINEEYLRDGGVRLTARVPGKNNSMPPRPSSEVKRTEGPAATRRITLDEWYEVINGLVRIEK